MPHSVLKVSTALVVAVLVTAALAGCSAASAPSGDSYASVRAAAEERYGQTDEQRLDQTLAELLPNHSFTEKGKTALPASAALVEGKIVSVEPIAGYYADKAANTVEVSFDDAKSLWRSAKMTIKVTRATGSVHAGESIGVGFTFDGNENPQQMLDGYRQLGTVVAILSAKTPRLFSGQDLYAIAHNGAMIATVEQDGTFDFIGLPAAEETTYVGKLTTVNAVFDQAK